MSTKTGKARVSSKYYDPHYRLVNRGDGSPYLFMHTLTDDDFVVCRDLKGKDRNYKSFHIYKSYDDFYNRCCKKITNKACYYEVIRGDRIQKPHFDIDVSHKTMPKGGDALAIGKSVMKQLIANIVRVMPDLDTNRILLFSSSNDSVFSYHVIIDGYYHVNNLQAHAFYCQVMKGVDKTHTPYIDFKVYSSIQQFRILGFSKVGDTRYKTHISEWTSDGYSGVCTDEDDYLVYMKSLITNCEGCEPMPTYEVVVKKATCSIDYEYLTDDAVEEAIEIVTDCFGKFPFVKYRMYGSGLVGMNRTHSSYCVQCDRVHESVGCMIGITVTNCIYYYCYNFLEANKVEKTAATSGCGHFCGKLVENLVEDPALYDLEYIIGEDKPLAKKVTTSKQSTVKSKNDDMSLEYAVDSSLDDMSTDITPTIDLSRKRVTREVIEDHIPSPSYVNNLNKLYIPKKLKKRR